MIIRVSNHADRIRLIAIKTMKGAFETKAPFAFLSIEETRPDQPIELTQLRQWRMASCVDLPRAPTDAGC